MDYKKYISTIPDFPKKGIMFRDVTSLLQNGEAYKAACNELTEYAKEIGAEVIAGPESRGYFFTCPVAHNLGCGFVPVRKPGKLPREVITESYSLEYGTNVLCMHKDAIIPGQKVMVIDDLLATGGTVKATINLIERLGGIVVGCAFLIELVDLKGREVIGNYPIKSLVEYEGE